MNDLIKLNKNSEFFAEIDFAKKTFAESLFCRIGFHRNDFRRKGLAERPGNQYNSYSYTYTYTV
jgi:hypothetical protein